MIHLIQLLFNCILFTYFDKMIALSNRFVFEEINENIEIEKKMKFDKIRTVSDHLETRSELEDVFDVITENIELGRNFIDNVGYYDISKLEKEMKFEKDSLVNKHSDLLTNKYWVTYINLKEIMTRECDVYMCPFLKKIKEREWNDKLTYIYKLLNRQTDYDGYDSGDYVDSDPEEEYWRKRDVDERCRTEDRDVLRYKEHVEKGCMCDALSKLPIY